MVICWSPIGDDAWIVRNTNSPSGHRKAKEKIYPSVIEMEWKPFSAAMMEPQFDFDPWDLNISERRWG